MSGPEHVSRRGFLSGTAATLAAGALGAAEPSAPGKGEVRPNILWICTDQQRYDTIAALGNRHVHTPNLDRLVADGVAFTHAHCQTPICTPSRAAFLTGMYPSTIHACINGNEHWAGAAPLVTKTLAEAGYDCGLAGKFHLSGAQGRIEPRLDDGYRVFHWSHHPSDDWKEGNAYIEWLRSQGRDYRKLLEDHGSIPAPWHQTTWCAQMAIEFLRQKRQGPWLFSLNCFAPHPPFKPPEDYLRRYKPAEIPLPLFRESDLAAQERLKAVNYQTKAVPPGDRARLTIARYWAEIELIDDQLGRIIEALRASGQYENTLIVFTSYHGEMLGDHGLHQKGCRFYEGLVRVPLIFSWPGRFKQGLRSDALVELIDIAPTLLEALGLEVPERMQGRSLLPILTGAADPHQHRESARSEYFCVLQGPPSRATMIRTRRHKLVRYHDAGLGELFDLEADPGEFENLYDDPRLAGARQELLEKSFDGLAGAVNIGPPRVSRF